MKTYRKLSLKSLLLYAISFVGGVLFGWWVKPKRAEPCQEQEERPTKLDDTNTWKTEDGWVFDDAGFGMKILGVYDRALTNDELKRIHGMSTDEIEDSFEDTQPIKVRYTAEEIMPISGKPNDYSLYWVFDANSMLWREAKKYYESLWSDGNLLLTNVPYYIPVAGAPPELKPVKGEPKEGGIYVCHHKKTGVWHTIKWDGNFWYAQYHGDYIVVDGIDWFIPYRISSAEGEK